MSIAMTTIFFPIIRTILSRKTARLKGMALTKALDELEAKADAAGKSLTLKPFLEAVGDQLSEEDAKKLLEGEDTLLQRSKKAMMLTTLFDFVNNNERKAGDYKVIRGTKYVTLVELLHGRKTTSVRILCVIF